MKKKVEKKKQEINQNTKSISVKKQQSSSETRS